MHLWMYLNNWQLHKYLRVKQNRNMIDRLLLFQWLCGAAFSSRIDALLGGLTVTHSSADWWGLLLGVFCFPWHRHQIPTAFTVSSERHWQSGLNGIAKVPKRKVFRSGTRIIDVAGRRSNPLGHRAHLSTETSIHFVTQVLHHGLVTGLVTYSGRALIENSFSTKITSYPMLRANGCETLF